MFTTQVKVMIITDIRKTASHETFIVLLILTMSTRHLDTLPGDVTGSFKMWSRMLQCRRLGLQLPCSQIFPLESHDQDWRLQKDF